MYYLTNSNFLRFLNFLHIDLPFCEAEAYTYYYSQYKLSIFDIDLHYFTKNEARALTIADQIFNDISVLSEKVCVELAEANQYEWVEDIAQPAYHLNHECKSLNSDFENFRIPESCSKERRDEYRAYFKAARGRYGYDKNQADPQILCRLLKAHFHLSESVEDLVLKNFPRTRLLNSKEIAFSSALDLEMEVQNIRSLLDLFHKKTENMSFPDIRSAYYRQTNKSLSKEEQDMFKSVHFSRRELVARILYFYFRALNQKGANIPLTLLELTGFRPCSHCCSH